MPEPTKEQMVEWLECGKHEERPRTNAMIDAILAALSEPNSERDRLWCSALIHELSMEDISRVTGYFNSIRLDKEKSDVGTE